MNYGYFCTAVDVFFSLKNSGYKSWWDFSQHLYVNKSMYGLTDEDFILCEENDYLIETSDHGTPGFVVLRGKHVRLVKNDSCNFMGICKAVNYSYDL